ncbi:Uncharacterised protein [Vibrio cholerae]|nr:Uncharacterised protein [Vibrio cholerae]
MANRKHSRVVMNLISFSSKCFVYLKIKSVVLLTYT